MSDARYDLQAGMDRIAAWTEQLCGIPGLSGSEDPVSAFIAEELRPLAADQHVDALGNLTVTVPGTQAGAPKIMVFAHTDQLGLVVRRIEPDGFLRVERLGGVPERVLPGLEVVVVNARGEAVPGVVCVKAHHATPVEEKGVVLPADKLRLDIGAESAAAVRALGIEIGAPVTYRPRFQRLGPHRICGTALDDRAGCAILMDLVRAVVERPVPATLQAVFSVQEEFNLRGAMVAAQRLRPDAAISVDIMVASDTPDLAERGELRLGGGPVLGLYSFHGRGTLNGTLAHPALVRQLERVGAAAGLALQRSAHTGALTDSSYVQLVGEGVPSIDVGYATRYTHTPIEMCDLRDLAGLTTWLHAALAGMPAGFSFARRA
jgi:putative aminopeptidase FrvX